MRNIFSHELAGVRATVRRDPEWQEYVVKMYVSNVHQPGADYYTGEVDDAIDTCKAMVQRQVDIMSGKVAARIAREVFGQ